MTEFMFTLTIITLVLAVYYLIYHVGTVWISMIAAVQIARETRWPHKFEEIETFSNPLAPLVSVIVPAHNEEAGIAAAVDSLRHLRPSARDSRRRRWLDRSHLRCACEPLRAAPAQALAPRRARAPAG